MRRFALCIFAGLLAAGAAGARADTLRLDAAKAVEMALSNPKQVELATAKMMEAVAGKGAAFGAFLPQISATGTYTCLAKVSSFPMTIPGYTNIPFWVVNPRTGETTGMTDPIPVYTPDTVSVKLGSSDNYALTGTVQQTLFTWGKLLNAYRMAGLSQEIQMQALLQARAQLRVDATSGYYQALLVRRTVGVMNDALRQLRGHVGQVQSLYDNGMATKLDLMKATLGLQQMEAQVSQVENGAELATAALLNTLGLDPATPVAFSEELAPDSFTVDVDQATQQALERRPELAQLRNAAKMAELGVRIARTANLPNAFAQANLSYKNPVGFSAEWGADWNATAGISMPIFTGLSNYSKLKAAQARHRQARIALALVEDGVKLEVKALALGLNQEAKNAAFQKKNVEVAEAALGLAQARYENGLLTNLDYMDSQVALTQARVAYLNAMANYQIAKAKLEKAIGEH
ncbi:TolC family protein [candidate division WOR-3 bacterium]|uniref:TolC family protein n=1 Tax=candidate division WOR-3 bacterium TaxID=2052148 RepID=A0A938BUC4_UNCW3|nr:TolC family protein [candidate division WOR-3 bacterium]